MAEHNSTYAATKTVASAPELANEVKKTRRISPVDEANRLYERALSMAKRHDISGAIALLQKILNTVPEFNDARETLAAIYIEQQQYTRAMNLLSEGFSIAPGYPPFINLQARILAAQNKLQQAITLLQSTSPPIAEYPDYYAFLAALYQQRGDYLISAKLYDELINIQPDNGLWWLGKAIGLNANGQRNDALKAYQRASTTTNLTPQLQAYVDEQIAKLE